MGKSKKESSKKVNEILEKVNEVKDEVQDIQDEATVADISEDTPLTPPVFQSPATSYADLTPPAAIKSERARSLFSRFGGLALFLLTLLVVGVLSFLVVRAARGDDDNSNNSALIEDNDRSSGEDSDDSDDSETAAEANEDDDSVVVGQAPVLPPAARDLDSSQELDIELGEGTAAEANEDDDSVIAIIGDDNSTEDDSHDSDHEGHVNGVSEVPVTGVSELPRTGAQEYMIFAAAIAFAVTLAVTHTRQLNSED